MPDLSEFGAGVEDASEDDQEGGFGDEQTYTYRTGRCRGITTDGRRCKSPSGYGEDCCHTHRMQHNAVTIDDGPVALIEATTRTLWADFENERVRAAVAEVTDA
jgi:hypothetical protein